MKSKIKPKPDDIQNFRSLIGDNIRICREKKGLSQDELSSIMEISRSTISKIENGKFSISIDYLFKFAWHLDFEVIVNAKTIL